jgi:MYXO-CTERM domain-containing protein
MNATLLALALTASDPFGFPAPRAAPARPAASIPEAAPSAAPPAPRPAAAMPQEVQPLRLPASTLGPGTFILPLAALLALALAALFASRRRRQTSRLIKVLESTSLGPKRALVVARVGDELLVLGASEAGLQLLATRPALPEEALQALAPARLRPVPAAVLDLVGDPDPEALAEAEAEGARPTRRLRAMLGRLGLGRPAPAPLDALPGFESLLAESAEDQELRRKLSMGLTGSVR